MLETPSGSLSEEWKEVCAYTEKQEEKLVEEKSLARVGQKWMTNIRCSFLTLENLLCQYIKSMKNVVSSFSLITLHFLMLTM